MYLVRLTVLILSLGHVIAADSVFSRYWFGDPDNLQVVGAGGVEEECLLKELSAPGGVFLPEEKVLVALARPETPQRSLDGAVIEAVGFNTAQFDAKETGFVFLKKARRIARTEGLPAAETPLAKLTLEGGLLKGEIALPQAFGMYALVLRRKEGPPTLIAGLARVAKPQPRLGKFPQMMAEWGLPGTREDKPAAAALARLGYGLVRRESTAPLARPGDSTGGIDGKMDPFFAACREERIKVMITFGVGPENEWVFGLQGGRSLSRVLPPSRDAELTQGYANFARRYWTGGDSGLWTVEHWNEPWEPNGISGWNGDSRRYRQILKCIHDGVKSVDKRIKVAATCSVMNTEDKLLSGDGRDSMRMVDLMTDHYVSLWAAYGPQVAEREGIVSGETETWGAHSQVLAAQFMTQFLSLGQKWLNPCTSDMLWCPAPSGPADPPPAPGTPRRPTPRTLVATPMPTAITLAAWNALIQDRAFKRIAFTGHLPYLYQFGDDGDARFVLCGKVTSTGSGRLRDYPWWQVLEGPNGSIAIPDPDRTIEVRDLNGNPVPRQADGGYTLPMNAVSFFVWSAKGAGAVIAAVKAGTVQGLQAVHISPSWLKPGALSAALHNALNREINGTLAVSSLDKDTPVIFTSPASLAAGADATLTVPLPKGLLRSLPLHFVFTPKETGVLPTEWTEVVQPAVISKATLPPSADAKAWEALPGATELRPQGEVAGNYIEAIWLPFVQKEKATVASRQGQVKLAYDDRALYLQAVVDAVGHKPHLRMATRDDDAFFWRNGLEQTLWGKVLPFERFLAVNSRIKKEVETAQKDPGWAEWQKLLESDPEAKKQAGDWRAQAWAAGRRKNATACLSDISYAYIGGDMIDTLPFSGDGFQFAFDVDPAGARLQATHDLKLPAGILPDNWTAVPDSDYEFALYQCQDGKPELWCLLAPGIPRGHFFPRQERGRLNQYAVQAECSVQFEDGRTTYRAAIPWSELGGKPWPAGSDVGVTCTFNAADGGTVVFGERSGATKTNGLSMHPYWLPKPSNTLRWTVMP
jgi:hypothetical protein